MEEALNLGPAQFVGAGGEGIEPAAVHNNGRQLVAIAIGQMDGVLQVIEGATAVFPLASLHQFSLTAAAFWGNDNAAELLTDGHGTAEVLEVVGLVHIGDHQAQGLIGVALTQRPTRNKKAPLTEGNNIQPLCDQAEPTPV